MTEEVKAPLTEESAESKNFILNFIDEDIAEGGRFQGLTVHTRFPPEPNGYLHIGHCKALCIDFGTAERYHGLCNLRMDDTNPAKEDTEYVDAIQQDIHWLGFDWGDRFFYGSDYFEKDYEYAVELIKKGLAYVCELTPEEFKANRGDIGIPATSPYRDRPIEENLRLFEKMKNGQDRPGQRQPEPPGPHHLPHPLHQSPPPGYQVVHLSHVRLCPPHPGRPGGHYPQPVLPGV